MDYSASFWVGGHPRAKGNAKVFSGRLVLGSAKEKAWQKQVRLVATREAPDVPLDVPVHLSCRFVFECPKKPKFTRAPAVKPDVDKLARCVLDALTGVIYTDDSRVVALHATKEFGEDEGVDVTVYEIGEG
jgi:crossover junction endodeoxyribonuclease RusA